jgi:hypothetical protein
MNFLQTSIQQQPYQPTNNGPPVFQQTPNQGAQFPSGAQQFPAPQTLAPYQPFSGFASPFSVPSQSPAFFNPFVPTSFSPAGFSVAPFGGLTFAPPLAPASFGPAVSVRINQHARGTKKTLKKIFRTFFGLHLKFFDFLRIFQFFDFYRIFRFLSLIIVIYAVITLQI